MYEILATEASDRDLRAIRRYLQEELYNPQAWDNLALKIRSAYLTLQDHPFAFEECRDERLRRKGYRKCVLGGYLFVYRVEKALRIVHIIRYFHGLQDYIAQL